MAPRPPAKAGTERRSSRHGWGLALLTLSAALGGILLLALWAGRDEFGTHRAYLLGDDGARVSLDYAALSPAMDEAALQRLLAPAAWRCSDAQGGAARLCEAALSQANGVPASRLRLTLRQGRLQQTEVFVPWWAHHTAARALTAQLGAPNAYDVQPPAAEQAPSLRWTFAQGALHLPLAPGWNPWRWSVLRWTAHP